MVRLWSNRASSRATPRSAIRVAEALEHLIIQKLLYNQSQIDSLTVPMDRVAERVQQLVDEQILERGSVAALEMYYHKPIFNIREELRETIEEGAYASEMERTIKDKVHVTPGEVEKFVKGMSKDSVPIIPEQYVFAQIVRYPSNADEAKLRAQERLLELRERIINGDKFDMLARTYSEDPQSAIRGGDLGLMTKEMLVPEFAEAMMKLKPGQVSGRCRDRLRVSPDSVDRKDRQSVPCPSYPA